MNDYTKDLVGKLNAIANNTDNPQVADTMVETIEHIRSLVSAAKEGWLYTDELEPERVRLTKLNDSRQVYGINAGDKSW